MAQTALGGKPCQTIGELPTENSIAPDFQLTDTRLQTVELQNFKDQVLVISIVPSLDTPTCARSTHTLNDMAARYPDVRFTVVSADLPFAMQRFCGKTIWKVLKACR